MHPALGWDYRDRRVRQGPVVYCAFEGAIGIAKRKEAFRQRFLAKHDGPVPFYLQPLTLNLVRDKDELIEAIRATLGSVKPVVLVLDTLNRSLQGSESKDEDMSAYVQAADAIRETFDCAIIIVHHCGIDGTRPRGHTSLTGAADVQLAVERDAANNIKVTLEYAKDGSQGDTISSRLQMVEVGIDERMGKRKALYVVLPVEADALAKPTQKKARSGPKCAKTAFRALAEAIADVGEPAPTSNHIPPTAMVTAMDRWRDYAYRRGISSSSEQRARQKAFKAATEYLVGQDWSACGMK